MIKKIRKIKNRGILFASVRRLFKFEELYQSKKVKRLRDKISTKKFEILKSS